MKKLFFLVLLLSALLEYSDGLAQFKKMDTALTSGNTGYRIRCSNSKNDANEVNIKLIGFEKEARSGMNIILNGQMYLAMIDDLNNDNFPDLVLIGYSGPHFQYGTAYAFASKENKSLMVFASKDIMLDGKLKPGYRGHDQFSLFEGSLIQKFPIYSQEDTDDKPSGGTRVIQYQMTVSESGKAYFKMLRTFDEK
jgi:hypothetical protein